MDLIVTYPRTILDVDFFLFKYKVGETVDNNEPHLIKSLDTSQLFAITQGTQ